MSVLDSSAVLAWLFDEPGHTLVDQALNGSLMCAVNWAEVLQKAESRQIDTSAMADQFEALGMTIVPFDKELATLSAGLWEPTKSVGLSLADRACLALVLQQQASVLTADRVWGNLNLGLNITIIR